MTKTSCKRCRFPRSMRWRHAGGDLAQPNPIHPPADRSLMRSKRPPKCLLHSPDLACAQTCRCRAGISPIIEIGASIKSP